MTRSEKITWLENATPDELVEQLTAAAMLRNTGSIAEKIEANEDYNLVKAELMKRLTH